MTDTYRPKPDLRIKAVQWDGENFDELEKLAAVEGRLRRLYREPSILLETATREPRLIHPGDWVSWDGSRLTVHSIDSFKRFWEKDD